MKRSTLGLSLIAFACFLWGLVAFLAGADGLAWILIGAGWASYFASLACEAR